MMKVDNKVDPISTIDAENKQDIRLSTKKAFAEESQISQVTKALDHRALF